MATTRALVHLFLALSCFGCGANEAMDARLWIELIPPEVIQRRTERVGKFNGAGRRIRVRVVAGERLLCDRQMPFPLPASAQVEGCELLGNARKPLSLAVSVLDARSVKIADGKASLKKEELQDGTVIPVRLVLRVPVARFD